MYSQDPQQPRFEAASIRLGGDIFSIKPQLSPGRLVWTTDLADLIGYAYGLDSSRVSAKGLRVVYAIYAINAVFEPNTTDDEVRRMLQSLLAERFNMRFHRQVKEVDGFAVTIGKSGLKMKESATRNELDHGDSGSGRSPAPIDESYLSATMGSPGIITITGREASITQLTRTLERIVGRPFWDQTGVVGKYDFAFSFSQDLV
jgi:uncharacterized protein (TIGR03435 family)